MLCSFAAFFAVPELRGLLGPGEMSYQDASAEIAAMAEDIRPAEAWVKHRKQLPGLPYEFQHAPGRDGLQDQVVYSNQQLKWLKICHCQEIQTPEVARSILLYELLSS